METNLTEEKKAYIDSLPYIVLLRRWRFTPAGDPWFQGETGKYWGKRLAERRAEDVDRVGVSKIIVWKE